MIITRAQPAAVPKKTERKSGLRMALLMDCIAAMPPAAGRRARACITATEKAKKSPAINPHPSAVTNVTVNRKPSTMAIMPPADRCPLYRRFEVFLRHVLVDAKDAHGARHRAIEDHPKKHPSTPPGQRPCWHREEATEDGHMQEDAADQCADGHIDLAVAVPTWL